MLTIVQIYQNGPFSTEDFRNSLLNRNLPPPVNETLTQSGLVSKLQDIGNIISVPILGTSSENIPIHYDENEKMFPIGTFYRTTQNVNLNRFVPQNDDYRTFELTVPPNLGYSTPQEFGVKEKGFYPTSYNSEQFFLVNKGLTKGVQYPFNVVDTYKSLNFQKESSLGLVGGVELEKTIIDKIAQVETQEGNSITPPTGDDGGVSSYVNRLRGSEQYFNTLPNGAVGWNEYNQNNGQSSGDQQEGVEPTLGTETRVNTLLESTNVSQVTFLFDLLNQNNYRPLYEDRRLQGTSEEGTNARYYIGSEKNTNRGSLITKTFDDSDFNGGTDTSGNQKITDVDEKFFWKTGGGTDFNEKTLLYKTQQLVNNSENDVFINQTKKYFKDKKQDRLISRGNAISPIALIDAEANGNYCRVWTVNDDYNYLKAIRNTGLFSSSDNQNSGFSVKSGDASLSVLMENGLPKYHPTKEDGQTTLKKYMLSIENLAWADNLPDLPLSEIGPGDILTKNKGRIMWFPPYGLSFDENTSANWTSTEFIGRSEPVYTYNNSKRSGQLSFKIVVDHPKVINGYRGKANDAIERFLAGCTSPNDFLDLVGKNSDISQTTKDTIEEKLNSIKKQESSNTLKQKLPDGPKIFLFENGSITPPINPSGKSAVTEWVNKDVKKWVQDQILSGNKVIITCEGYASKKEKQNKVDEDDPNVTNKEGTTKKLSKNRAKEVRDLIKAGTGGKGITFKIVAKGSSASTDNDDDNNRRVDVTIENNSKDGSDAEPKKENLDGLSFYPEFADIIDGLIIDETKYFDFVDANYPNYFKTISQKIQYFQPGYHSTTPEGLNTRLTFLNQCMRQGPSINNTGDAIQPQNLAFGRPPICILRIGDFFHTKVAINSLNITYDDGGIKWDLNPEGIGVQPMIANVQLSIDLLGGHSLVGPIDRLQNAVSFNYYANTQLYDPRADKIDGSTGKIVEGIKLGTKKSKVGVDPNALTDFLKNEGIVDQLKDSETGDDDGTESQSNIKIDFKNSDIIIRVLNSEGEPESPSEVKIDGEVDKDNLLSYKVRVNGKGTIPEEGRNVDKNDSVVTLSKDMWSKGADINTPTGDKSLSTLEDILEEKELALSDAQDEVTGGTVTQNIKKIKELEKEIEKLEKDIEKAEKKQTKVKVVAFFTKNKSGSKQTVEFTFNGKELTY